MAEELTNQQIADLFHQVAAALTIEKADVFRTRAYERAATTIEQTAQPLRQIWEKNQLGELPGLGPAMQQHLEELFKTGEIKHFQQIYAKMPDAMFTLMKVNSIGAKTAFLLSKEFELPAGQAGIDKLKKVAEAGKIQILEGFGERSEQEILEALGEYKEEEKRMLVSLATSVTDDVMAYLRKTPDALEVESLGSLRRRVSTIGDLDFAVKTKEPDKIMEYLKKYPGIRTLISTGTHTTSFYHQHGPRIDVKTQDPERWGSMLQHYTGSKQHNIKLRSMAQEKGWSLSENGLKINDKLEVFKTEAELYKAFGMDEVPPELREDQGEIQAAQKHTLPKLVELKDIKGDLQMHTALNFPTSHDLGQSSVAELMAMAAELGYEYIGLSDHNPPQSTLNDKERLEIVTKRRAQIEKEATNFAKTHKNAPHVLTSMEVDILPSGELALADDALEILDYALVSIHSQFRGTEEETTARILKGLAHPKVKILAHPTGRLLLQRASIKADWSKIFAFCAEKGIAVEVNASPSRLDLPEELAHQAILANVMLVINTDSHSASGLHDMQYGVWQARRGWAEKANVLNTQSWDEIKKFLLK